MIEAFSIYALSGVVVFCLLVVEVAESAVAMLNLLGLISSFGLFLVVVRNEEARDGEEGGGEDANAYQNGNIHFRCRHILRCSSLLEGVCSIHRVHHADKLGHVDLCGLVVDTECLHRIVCQVSVVFVKVASGEEEMRTEFLIVKGVATLQVVGVVRVAVEVRVAGIALSDCDR